MDDSELRRTAISIKSYFRTFKEKLEDLERGLRFAEKSIDDIFVYISDREQQREKAAEEHYQRVKSESLAKLAKAALEKKNENT